MPYPKMFLAILAAAALTACNSQPPATVQAAAPAPTAVAPAKPATEFQASGPLVVENQVDVATQREGVVARIFADVGTRVRKGELLAQLDDRQLRADRDAADANVKSLTEDLKHWEALDKVHDADLSRSEEMWKANIISAQQLEHDRYTSIGSKFEIARQEQDLRNAKEKLEALDLELEKTRIVAPFDGVVARRYIRLGQKVAGNDRLFWISATAPLNVVFTLPQEYVGRIHVGDEIHVVASLINNTEHAANIRLISPVVDPSSGTIEVQARVAGEPSDLRPGMTVNIKVPHAPVAQ